MKNMNNTTEEKYNTGSNNEDLKGVVFNIQRYSIHDGPGIRTTIFLKGCPLSCLWCQNPESQSLKPEIFYNAEKCIGCGRCIAVCPEKAVTMHDGKAVTDRRICTGCGTCTEECPEDARELAGKYMTAREVFNEAVKDDIFYKRSGGGITLSGGDPFAQSDFSTAILKLCREAKIHTAIETCGYASWKILEKMLIYVDLLLYDLKHMDSGKHKELTGVPNDIILDNVKKIWHILHIPLFIRIPVIPGYNDSLQNIEASADFIAKELDPSVQINILPYHRLGESKIVQLERPEIKLAASPPDENYMLYLKEIMEARGLQNVVIGG